MRRLLGSRFAHAIACAALAASLAAGRAGAVALPPHSLGGWGTSGTASGQFLHPHGVCTDAQGNVYVADFGNARIQKFSGSGTWLASWGGFGSAPGQFGLAFDLACDPSGNVYVLEWANARIQVFDGGGNWLRAWGAPGHGAGQLWHPTGIAVSPFGDVFVADAGNHRVVRFLADGTLVGAWGTAGSGANQFGQLRGIATSGQGDVFVADAGNSRIARYAADGTLLGTWGTHGLATGQFDEPRGVATDFEGNVYVTDVHGGDGRVQVFSGDGTFRGQWGPAADTVLAPATAWPQEAAATPNLTVDGSQQHQTLAGVGVNLNVQGWKGGRLAPALDALTGPAGLGAGAGLVRVVRDPMTWVASEADVPLLRALDPATLDRIYTTPAMQDLWHTIAYLNASGRRGPQVVLNFMGWLPAWLGGSGAYGQSSYLTPGKEGALATVIASLVWYGRNVAGLDFSRLGPLNEPEWNCLEGPCVAAAQYVVLLDSLAARLDAMGLTDVRFVGPDAASISRTDPYVTLMMADPLVASHTDALGMHIYDSATSPRTAYPGHAYWLTETSAWCAQCDTSGAPAQGEWSLASKTGDIVLADITNGIAGICTYEGFDSFYYHHNRYSTWGLLAVDTTTQVYTTRKRFHVNAQVAGWMPPGATVLGVSLGTASISACAAAQDPATGSVTIAGHNSGATALTVNGKLLNLAGVTRLALVVTDPGSASQQRLADVAVTGGTFTASVPANAFFSFSSGMPPQGSFKGAGGVALDLGGNVFVADDFGGRIAKFSVDLTGVPAATSRFVLEPVRPNPLREGSLAVRFTLPAAARARVDVVDVTGRRVLSREFGTLGPGPHALDVAPVGRLEPGVYFVRLAAGGRTAVRRASVVR